MTIGDNIKKARKSLHLSQTEFGKRVSVGRDVIANIENGRVEHPNPLLLDNIRKEYNLNKDFIFIEEDNSLLIQYRYDDMLKRLRMSESELISKGVSQHIIESIKSTSDEDEMDLKTTLLGKLFNFNNKYLYKEDEGWIKPKPTGKESAELLTRKYMKLNKEEKDMVNSYVEFLLSKAAR